MLNWKTVKMIFVTAGMLCLNTITGVADTLPNVLSNAEVCAPQGDGVIVMFARNVEIGRAHV